MKKILIIILVMIVSVILVAANTSPSTGTPILSLDGSDLKCLPVGDFDLETNDIYHIYDFRRDGASLNVLNMQFENSAKDYSTYTNNGLTNNLQYLTTAGPDGSGAYYFNAGNAEIEIINSPSLAFDSAGTYTWEFWILPGELNRDQKIITKQGSHIGGYDIRLSSENMIEFVSGYDYTNYLTAQYPLQMDQWYHVVVTYNNGQIKVYINSVEQTLIDFSMGWNGYPSTFVSDNTRNMYISAASDEVLHAVLDNIRIYNRILSQQEITNEYQMKHNILASQELASGTWTCAITPNDWYLDGTEKISNNYII
ncbi:LamG domain-containing protein [Candidatus Woesearchaeota archaeon]|nr:LamG domain-containing protein [Candidatus Woesearchaeota archaeon]